MQVTKKDGDKLRAMKLDLFNMARDYGLGEEARAMTHLGMLVDGLLKGDSLALRLMEGAVLARRDAA